MLSNIGKFFDKKEEKNIDIENNNKLIADKEKLNYDQKKRYNRIGLKND